MSKGFAETIRLFAEQTDLKAQRITQSVQKEVVISVIKSSPVDSGAFRMNWQGSREQPVNSILTGTDPSGAKAISAAIAQTFGGDGKFYLSNSLSYGPKLEYGLYNHATSKTTSDGFSSQAPAGMVRVNLARITNNLRSQSYVR